jgi:predicted hotdog family 3-hydroxylacyl-ACP dehydratase
MNLLPVAALIPHQPPMRLIDDLIEWDVGGITARVHLTEASPFMNHGRVRALFGMEYLAQAAAAWFTLMAMQDATPVVRQGMLIACPRLDTEVSHFRCGSTLLVRAEPASRLPEDGRGLVKFTGLISVMGEGTPTPVLQAQLSVYL